MGALDLMRYDPDPYGISQEFIYDDAQDIMVVRSVQDVEPFLQATKAKRREADAGRKGYSPSRDLRQVAEIPFILCHKWLMEGIDVFSEDDWPAVAAKLDDPEYAFLRTAPGFVGSRPHRTTPMTVAR